jgi:hypothetical protein
MSFKLSEWEHIASHSRHFTAGVRVLCACWIGAWVSPWASKVLQFHSQPTYDVVDKFDWDTPAQQQQKQVSVTSAHC